MVALDQTVFESIHSLAGQSKVLDWFGIFFANYMPYIFIGLVVYLLLREGTWRKKAERCLALGMTLVLSYGIIGAVLHFFINRPRPFVDLGFQPLFSETGNAFPSRHALILFSIASLVFSFNKKIGLWLFFFAFINGVARVFSGVHWPGDILGGAVVGILSYIITSYALKKYWKDEGNVKEEKAGI